MAKPKTKSKHRRLHDRGLRPLLRPTSMFRAWLFVLLNLAGYAFVNGFWQYLWTGRWVGFSLSGFGRDLSTPLGALLLHPLSVLSYPWMIAVMGVLLAVVVFVPIIVAVLYRLGFALMFVLIVALVGHAPVLALSLLIGCLLAGRTPLRSDMPFLATLLGLVPVAVYFYIFGFGGTEWAAVMPVQRWLLSVPLLLAIVTAVVASAVVLWLAKLTRFRPGVVWPVLAALLVGPVLLFYWQIGPDRLHYELIRRDLSAGDAVFETVSLDRWMETKAQEGRDVRGLSPDTLAIAVTDDLKQQKVRLADKCRRFLDAYPSSQYAPEVLWILGLIESVQFDYPALAATTRPVPSARSERVKIIKYSSAYPLPYSAAVWKRLVEQHPDSPQAALARWRLGELALREGQLQQAEDLLARAAEALPAIIERLEQQSASENVDRLFVERVAIPTQSYYVVARHRALRLLWLMVRNDVRDDPPAAEAMRAWMRLNPRGADYLHSLQELAARYHETNFGDNLALEVILRTEDPIQRARQLTAFIETWQFSDRHRTDATVRAYFELGRLTSSHQIPGLKEPEWYFKRVVSAPNDPPNPWLDLAQGRLAWMETGRTAAPDAGE
ncbi:MAG: tetratricopeptide repeat protein [Phycisphaerae bacterium]